MSDGGPDDGPIEGPTEEVEDIIERGLSEIETVADNYYENIRDRIHAAAPDAESSGGQGESNDPIEDETGHAKWNSQRPANRSPDLSDEEESEDDRRTTGRSMKSSMTQIPDRQRPRRLRPRDWDADFPPLVRNTLRRRSGSYARPRRGSIQALQYRPVPIAINPPHTRTRPPPYGSIYDPLTGRAMYRSRSLTPPPRRGSRLDPSRCKREKVKDKIKPLAAGAAGFVAGGYIGHAAGKGSTTATLAGAVIGAIGGLEIEEEWEKHKEKGKQRMRD